MHRQHRCPLTALGDNHKLSLTDAQMAMLVTGIVVLAVLLNCGGRPGMTPNTEVLTTNDERLKTDITRTGHNANRASIYTYRYIGTDTVFQDMMAQDAKCLRQNAVEITQDGFLVVDYDKIGAERRTARKDKPCG